MATGNLFQGTARGKVGDVVFFRTDGEQRSRVRVRKIKDRKSEAQMIQRAITATVVEAYSFMSDICDHSFEGVQYGQKSMYYFNKVNADRLRTAAYDSVNAGEGVAYFSAPKVSALVPNGYIISKGSLLNSVGYEYDATKKAFVLSCMNTVAKDGAKFGDVLSALGLLGPRTLLTFCSIVKNPKVALPLYTLVKKNGGVVASCMFVYDRVERNSVVVSDEDADKPWTGYEELMDKYFVVDRVTGSWLGRLGDVATGTAFEVQDSEELAVGTIKSELVGGVWKRSSECMVVTPSKDALVGLNYNRMLQAWKGTIVLGKSDYYLNGGD